MGKIEINGSVVENHSDGIKGTAAVFTAQGLNSVDIKSTISAVQKSNRAYQASQTAITNFGGTLSKDVDNLRSINVAYKQYDEMLAQVISLNRK